VERKIRHKIVSPSFASIFGIKSYKVCESSSGYLWQIIIYTAKTTDMASEVVSTENLKTQILVKLAQPLFNIRHTLWMDNYYNSPDLCLLLKQQGMKVTGTSSKQEKCTRGCQEGKVEKR
jgi:hypothetical protein